MEANEAPMKIYYAPYGDMRVNHPITDNDIEYIRTDVFIEKAERYIRSVADGLDRDDDVEAFISEFRKHMKGE